jgi:hypothetical protein
MLLSEGEGWAMAKVRCRLCYGRTICSACLNRIDLPGDCPECGTSRKCIHCVEGYVVEE